MEKEYLFPAVLQGEQYFMQILDGKTEVYLFGLGELGKKMLHYFLSQKVGIKGILDNNSSLWGECYEGIAVLSPDTAKGTSLPVIICADASYEEISQQLEELNIKARIPYYFYLSQKSFTYQEFLPISRIARYADSRNCIMNIKKENPFVLSIIDVPITDKCSLKCKDCSNLMQYFVHPQNADMKKTLLSVDTLLQNVDYLHELRLLGGEPFVHQELYQYVEACTAYQNVGSVVLFTNGTILPKGKNLESLKSQKVIVEISNYGPLSSKLAQLTELFEKEKIFYHVLDMENWTDCAEISPHGRSEEELKEIYRSCCVTKCLTLRENLLYGCPFHANAAALAAIPSSCHGAVDILSCGDRLREEIKKLQGKGYLPACEYCKGRPRGAADIQAAIQTPSPLPYHRYED